MIVATRGDAMPGPDAPLPEGPDDLGVPPDGEEPEEEPRDDRRWWQRWSRGPRQASDEDRGCDWDWDWDGCDGCDGCDCNPGCDLMRLSTVLVAVAALHPPGGPGRAAALGALRLYRRRLSRFTHRCPGTPSCSAYAETAVRRLGARRGLAEAARRVAACGQATRR